MGRGGQNLIYGEVQNDDNQGEIEKQLDSYLLKIKFSDLNESQFKELIKEMKMPSFKSFFLRNIYNSLTHYKNYSDQDIVYLHKQRLGVFVNDMEEIQERLLSSLSGLVDQGDSDQQSVNQINEYVSNCSLHLEKVLNRILINNSEMEEKVIKTDLAEMSFSGSFFDINSQLNQLKNDINFQINENYDEDDIDFDDLQEKEHAALTGLGLSAIKSSLQKINNSSQDTDISQKLEKLQEKVVECSWAIFLYHYIELIHDIEGKPFDSRRNDYGCFVDDSQQELLEQF